MTHLEDLKQQIIGGGGRERDYSKMPRLMIRQSRASFGIKICCHSQNLKKTSYKVESRSLLFVRNEDCSSCMSSLQARKEIQQKGNLLYTRVSEQNPENLIPKIHWLQKHNYVAKKGVEISDGIQIYYNLILQKIHITGIATVLQVFNLPLKMFTGYLTLIIKRQLKPADGKI